MSRIAIISDDNFVLNSTAEKFVALRSSDTLVKCGFSELEHIKNSIQICIVYFERITQDAIKFIKELKTDENIIILICSEFGQQPLLEAFDAGISDFCRLNSPNYELLIKVINAQKLLDKNLLLKNYKNQLSDKGVIRENTGIYYRLTDALKNFDTRNTALVSINVDNIEEFMLNNGEKLIANNLRINDKIVFNGSKYLFILQNTNQNQAKNLFLRLQTIIDNNINGEILNLNNKNEVEILDTLAKLETERVKNNLDIISEITPIQNSQEDWLDNEIKYDEEKNYKFFQTIYDKKRENVIKPVLYRAVQKYENTFEDTKLKYYVEKNSAELLIMNFDGNAALKITFNNSPKITLTEEYSGLNTPENKQYELKFNDLSVRNFTPLVERFINDFCK